MYMYNVSHRMMFDNRRKDFHAFYWLSTCITKRYYSLVVVMCMFLCQPPK